MPTMYELEMAADQLATRLSKDCPPHHLDWFVRDVAKFPGDWGFPQCWVGRPNWSCRDLRTQVSWRLWRMPNHPRRIPRAFWGLPFRVLQTISDGYIQSLWYDAPSGAVRHEWLTQCAINRRFHAAEWRDWLANPWRWYCRFCDFIGDYNPRSRIIAEWLIHKKEWKGWRQPIAVGYAPNGEMSYVEPAALLDEIYNEDLVSGIKTSPERVFRAVLARKSETEMARIAQENALFPKMPWTEIQGVRQIMTARELVEEGRRMYHCVGTYSERCRRAECFILRLPNSTAEILPDGSVYQHRGYNNSNPCKADRDLLTLWMLERKKSENQNH